MKNYDDIMFQIRLVKELARQIECLGNGDIPGNSDGNRLGRRVGEEAKRLEAAFLDASREESGPDRLTPLEFEHQVYNTFAQLAQSGGLDLELVSLSSPDLGDARHERAMARIEFLIKYSRKIVEGVYGMNRAAPSPRPPGESPAPDAQTPDDASRLVISFDPAQIDKDKTVYFYIDGNRLRPSLAFDAALRFAKKSGSKFVFALRKVDAQ